MGTNLHNTAHMVVRFNVKTFPARRENRFPTVLPTAVLPLQIIHVRQFARALRKTQQNCSRIWANQL